MCSMLEQHGSGTEDVLIVLSGSHSVAPVMQPSSLRILSQLDTDFLSRAKKPIFLSGN